MLLSAVVLVGGRVDVVLVVEVLCFWILYLIADHVMVVLYVWPLACMSVVLFFGGIEEGVWMDARVFSLLFRVFWVVGYKSIC